MSNPQLEEGYFNISNELWDALIKVNLGGVERQVLDAVIRKTYGWHKKEDKISISQICEMTGASKRAVVYAQQNLESKKMIIVKRTEYNGAKLCNTISFNKKYEEWVVQNCAPQVKRNRGSAKLRKKVVQNSVKKLPGFAHTKDTITKDNTKDNIMSKASPIDVTTAKELFAMLVNNNPAFAQQFKNGNKGEKECMRWAEDIRKMREIDGRESNQIRAVISWVGSADGSFWQSNIMSGSKLRKQYNVLVGQMSARHQKQQDRTAFIS